MRSSLTLESIDIIRNDTYAQDGYPHEAWTLLRRRAPVFWYDRPGCRPFWAITKHEDIVRVSRAPEVFRNAPRLAVLPDLEGEQPPDELPARHLLNMDPPDHNRFRRLVSARFTPRAIDRLRPSVNQICAEILDGVCHDGAQTTADFVTGVSAKLPLAVLADLLGAPRDDWEILFHWTNEIIGSADPGSNRPRSVCR
jgi:cholest-4-en-3-one 26-monooxygenase